MSFRLLAAALAVSAGTLSAQTELTTNGDFETGDFTGWQLFPSQAGNITIGAGNGSTFGANVDNTVLASNSFMKHANLGAGQVSPGDTVTISLDMRGTTAIGGLVFVQVFWEISGGGVSGAQLLGPIFADPDPMTWTNHSFMVTAGPDVSGGVSVQLEAVTGGAPGSVSSVSYDNVSVTIPAVVPATYPGTGEDLALETGVNGDPNGMDVKTAAAGDVLTVNVASEGGTYDNSPYFLAAQLVTTGNVGSIPNIPELHFDIFQPIFIIVDPNSPSPIGGAVIPPITGATTSYVLPSGLSGLSLILQAMVADPFASNNKFAATDAHEIQFP